MANMRKLTFYVSQDAYIKTHRYCFLKNITVSAFLRETLMYSIGGLFQENVKQIQKER